MVDGSWPCFCRDSGWLTSFFMDNTGLTSFAFNCWFACDLVLLPLSGENENNGHSCRALIYPSMK